MPKKSSCQGYAFERSWGAMSLHIQSFHRRFRNNNQCLQYLFDMRFSSATCTKCKRINAYHKHPTKQCYTCNCGQSQIYPRKGTIFGDSPVPLLKWFYAVFLMCQSRNGISARELERRLDVTYATAWRMSKKIRSVLPDDDTWWNSLSIESFLLPCMGEKIKRTTKVGRRGPTPKRARVRVRRA